MQAIASINRHFQDTFTTATISFSDFLDAEGRHRLLLPFLSLSFARGKSVRGQLELYRSVRATQLQLRNREARRNLH